MWKFTAEYENWDGEPRKKELFFNLTISELTRLQNTVKGGIDSYYQHILDARDNVELYRRFEELVKLAYGEKSLDGERFVKNDEIFTAFKESMAYDVFMQYLMTTDDGAAKFINGIMPPKLKAQLNTPEGKKIAEQHGIDISNIT